MAWKKEPPHMDPHIGCLNCGAGEMRGGKVEITATMRTRIYGGFGGWHIEKDGEVQFRPPQHLEWEKYPTLMKFENMARKDPDHDWRAVAFLPLRDATYQRHGRNRWVLISSGPGFA